MLKTPVMVEVSGMITHLLRSEVENMRYDPQGEYRFDLPISQRLHTRLPFRNQRAIILLQLSSMLFAGRDAEE
jgi:hypothetical protein